ncbi:NAD(P)-dependent oxidoreductase [Pseudoclavibacter sp. 13-3]|uniref:NAD(P)-dependent oxidoreductase n=1 Tax=Pseudoclavibacter sp. 13-3 TaxID=2901228 RepID=UPI001E5B42E7|nr:NAD(P)-dependent oxidoreductase [Pseudoclavibacter sp. 13-3]MCD7101308.1 NAD(P)-binding domain-containing protein [Pseudoclavibacter sp. 13-3]
MKPELAGFGGYEMMAESGTGTALLLRVDQTDAEVEYIRSLVEHRGFHLVSASPESVPEGQAASLLLAAPASPVDGRFLCGIAGLRAVATPSVGVDHIDIGAAQALGITVCSAPGYNATEVAEYALSGILLLLKDLLRGAATVADREWRCRQLEPIALQDAVVGLIGFGTIARRLAVQLHELDVRTLVWNRSAIDRYPESSHVEFCASMQDLVATCDVVSLHVPLTNSTANMVGPQFLTWMKAGSGLVNTARGGLIDATAVADALHRQHLRGAVLDVLEHEPPLWQTDPLLSAPHALVTPHQAWLTPGSRYRGWDVAVEAATGEGKAS